MNKHLKVWLNSLSAEERTVVEMKLGSMAIETEEEQLANVMRKAAGLPEVDVDPNEDKILAAARKAAGLG
mgnify:FL=1